MNLTQGPLLVFSLFFSVIHHLDSAEPLIFNPKTLEIFTNSLDSSNLKFEGPFAEACPLDTENRKENKININITRDGKGLMVRNVHNSSTAEPITWCRKGFELAAVFRTGEDTWDVFEFGYEIYFRYNTLKMHFYNLFDDVIEQVSYARFILPRIFRTYMYDDSDYYHIFPKKDKNLEFMWLRKIRIRYDVDLWNFIEIKYSIHRNVSRQLKVKCKDHNLGNKLYDRAHRSFNRFYSVTNQKKIFANVNLPEGSGCELTFECLKKYDMLMPYHFEPYQNSPVSCSNLTTIPIWHQKIEKLLNNLEIFLIAMGQLIPEKLNIIPDVYGVLSFPKRKTSFMSKSSTMPMYLYPRKQRIPVPRIIYKIIRYQSYKCKAENDLCWFEVVIVIHNEPEVSDKEKLCAKDMCEEWGWERIKFTNASANEKDSSEHIYCCEWNEQLGKRLGYQSSRDLAGNLDLHLFPIYDLRNDATIYVNKKEEFNKRMEELKKEIETE